MKILYLSHRIPYPPNKGDKIRSFNEIKYLSKNHEIHLGCLADDPKDLKYESNLKTYCKKTTVVYLNKTLSKIKSLTALTNGTPMTVKYFYSKKLQSKINRWLSDTQYDAILCFSSPMAEYVFRSKPLWTETAQGTRYKAQGSSPTSQNSHPTSQNPHPRPRLVIDFCDLDSDKWAQYASRSTFPKNLIYKRESRQLLSYEKLIHQQFNHTIFVSQPEADLFKNHCPKAKNVTVIPNGVDTTYFDPNLKFKIEHSKLKITPSSPNHKFKIKNSKLKIVKSPILLFTGAMDYHANIDGVLWFHREIYPLIKNVFPDVQFYIVGSNPHPDVKTLANGNSTHVTGYVEDIRPYYHSADICVVPIRSARGVQNKVLEAMAMEKAIVSTSQATQGINAENNKHLLIADTPQEFSKAVVNLLKDDSLKKTLKTNARTFVEKNYNWSIHMEGLKAILNNDFLT